MKKWDYVCKFTLDGPELSLAADSHLTKKQVRRSGMGELSCYIQYGIVEAESLDAARRLRQDDLHDLLDPYGVSAVPFEEHVILVQEVQ